MKNKYVGKYIILKSRKPESMFGVRMGGLYDTINEARTDVIDMISDDLMAIEPHPKTGSLEMKVPHSYMIRMIKVIMR